MESIVTTKNRESSAIVREMFFGSLSVLIFSSVSTMLGSLVDGIITSRFLGDAAMASFSIVSPVYNILMMLSGILSSGTQVAYTRHIGRGDADRARAVFNICFFTALGLSVTLMIVSFFGSDVICSLLGASGKDANMLPMASAYLKGFALGFPANLLVPIISGFMQIDGDRQRTVYATGIMTATNITGDLLNVFVFHGGMFGMAFATSVANYVALVILLLHFTKKNIVLAISPRGLVGSDIGEIVKNGLPNAIANGSLMLQKITLNYLLLAIAGQWAVSALGKSFTFYGFVNTVQMGIGQSVMLIAGILAGEEDARGLKDLQNIAIKFSLICAVICCAVILLFTPVFVGLFMADTTGEAYTAALAIFRANALGLPFMGINLVFMLYLQGIRNAVLARTFSFLERAVYIIGLAVLLGVLFGVDGVWVAMPIAEIATLLTYLVVVVVRKGKRESLREGFLFLRENFGALPENLLEFSMQTMDDVVFASDRVQQFVRSHGGSARESMMLPLCLEEMAGNIIRFGFSDGKAHHIESKVIRKEDGFVIRLKDDCAPFSPTEWLSLHEAEDKTANIGIRMVTAVAKEVRYVSSMQMNCLILDV